MTGGSTYTHRVSRVGPFTHLASAVGAAVRRGAKVARNERGDYRCMFAELEVELEE